MDLSLELLCADDFGAGRIPVNQRSQETREHLANFYDTWNKHQELELLARELGISVFTARTDDKYSQHSDAYLYFSLEELPIVIRLLRKIDLPGDVLDIKTDLTSIDRKHLAEIADGEGWNLGDGWDY